MASKNVEVEAQFQEPPVADLPAPSNNTNTRTTSDPDLATQFQEPISPQPTTSSSSSTTGAPLTKSTSEKLKEVVKKPFQRSGSSDVLGQHEVTSPEMEAAKEVLEGKGLKA